ncbi:hypothetical protein C427_1501 [Paraglaciecola psychrophila 170]|uniref:Uncharacterized protein n=1 Tax=Paraglaciecola psychrophila 170 TaxID=1129794 RepID=K7AX60_9ALTE|nr:hypothetical protein C427_1501 [Paraglaciecola psychrophila 170]GAC39715.1 hypothetical protein GPSY_4104 [Paraglaciecola psychrophila 170]
MSFQHLVRRVVKNTCFKSHKQHLINAIEKLQQGILMACVEV